MRTSVSVALAPVLPAVLFAYAFRSYEASSSVLVNDTVLVLLQTVLVVLPGCGVLDTSCRVKLQQYLLIENCPLSSLKITDIEVVDVVTLNVGAGGTEIGQ